MYSNSCFILGVQPVHYCMFLRYHMGRFSLWARLNIQSHQCFQALPSGEPFHLAFLYTNPGLSSITIVLDVKLSPCKAVRLRYWYKQKNVQSIQCPNWKHWC